MTNLSSDQSAYVEVHDHRAFGLMLIEYALGRRLGADGEELEDFEPRKWPSFEEFVEEVEARNIAKVPDHMKGIKIVQPPEDTVFLRIPPKSIIEAALQRYRTADPSDVYGIPDFYKQMILAGDDASSEGGIDKLEFFFNRVGDYTMSFCG